MSPALIGQILGVSIACGLNLYLTVAALGILARVGIIDSLPPGLHGLEGLVVIASAATLFIVEAVVDKVRHVDSAWDVVHALIRPPAAALLAVGALWSAPLPLVLAGAGVALMAALTTHVSKAGYRLALNANAPDRGHPWISTTEDALAVTFAALAFLDPLLALGASATVLLVMVLFARPYWRAFRLGTRGIRGWLRSLFSPAGWREAHELPDRVRRTLEATPLGAAPPRGTRAAVLGVPGLGGYRNGWLVVDFRGLSFVYRGLLGSRRAPLPAPQALEVQPGIWADMVHIRGDDETAYTLYMLKDGPGLDLALPQLQQPAL